ncbi:MAG: gliding motility-associated C-terminal domain-containing protein, partial [Bacteroidota bacterium]
NQVGTGESYVVDAAEIGQTYVVFGQATDPTTGCEQVVPVTVVVSELTGGLPLDAVTACPGESPEIFGEIRPSGGLTYTYEPPGVIDDSDPSAPVFVGDASTTVTVTVTDAATGCTSTETIDVTVVDFGGLNGTADPNDILLGESSTLTVTGCEGDDCTYDWMVPNGTITPDDGPVVEATPDMPGTLIYEVEVASSGCTEIVEIELRVTDPLCDEDNIFIPNAFSPNGDNMNDVMRVRSRFAEQLSEFRFIIYNRWGQEVYASEDIFESWDGTVEGDSLEPDVYGYWVRVICPGGEEFIKQGNITLLR